MIRILHNIGTLNYGGSQALVMAIYRQIDRSKIQFDFVTIADKTGGFYDEAKELGARVYVCPRYNGKNHIEFCKWWNDFWAEHPEYKIIHGHVRSTASIYLTIAKKHGLVTIAHSHSTSNGSGKSALVKNILQLPIRYIADWCFACSDEAGRWLFGKNIINKSNYMLIPNAIDGRRFLYSEEKRDEIRKYLKIEDRFVIGHVGRFDISKNHFLLVDIFEEVYRLNPKAYLLLIGDGELRPKVEEYCKSKGIYDHVCFSGIHNNVEDYYQAMDVFLFPSKWEGLGIVAVEAQTSGLPCVVSQNVPSKVDIGANLVNFLELEDSVGKWASAILDVEMVTRKSCLLELQEAGYDISELTDKLEQFYIGEFEHRKMR